MALKLKYSSKTEIPAELVSHYAERDGIFVLDCPDVVEKTKLEEFRSNNVALNKQLAELNTRFAGLDPAAVAAAVEAKRKLDEGELLKKGDNRPPRPASGDNPNISPHFSVQQNCNLFDFPKQNLSLTASPKRNVIK